MNTKISFNNWNPEQLIIHMEKELHGEWCKLCEEYQIANVPLFTKYDNEIYNMIFEIAKNHDGENATLNSFDRIYRDKIERENVFITWMVGANKIDDSLIHCVIGRMDSFIYLMLLGLPKYDLFVDYLKFELRHEMGHILSNLQLKKQSDSYEDFREKLNALYQEQKAMIKNCDINMSDEEFTKFYFSLPMEMLADEAVGYTWKDHLNHRNAYKCWNN